MQKSRHHFGLTALAAVALAGAWALPTTAARQQPTYWMGIRQGNQIVFNTRVPADAAAIIKHNKPAPGKGANTRPRFTSRTETANGKSYGVYSTELGWDSVMFGRNSVSFVTDSGVGAEWRNMNPADPLYKNFSAALVKQSIPFGNGGWRQIKVYMLESPDGTPPPVRLNRDGTSGTPSREQLAVWRVEDIAQKPSLSPQDAAQLRAAYLDIANAGRANPNYRREMGSRTILDLPSNLPPFRLNEKLNRAAQMQAEYCAANRTLTHNQPRNPAMNNVPDRLKAVGYNGTAVEAGGAGQLTDYPKNWMKSETHYRPWWGLDGPNENEIGFGFAKASDGTWYVFAVPGFGEKK